MIYLWLLLMALLTIGLIIWIGKLPASSWPILGLALMLAFGGYAMQNQAQLPGKPVKPAKIADGFGEVLTDRQRGMQDRFGPAGMWISMSDGFMRTGKTELAAKTLQKALVKYPDNVDLWVSFGNALVAHGGGMISPAATLAFDEAARREPNHPAPPFFAGLALAQSGDFANAEKIWVALQERTTKDAPWALDLEENLARLRQAMGKRTGSQLGPE